jgi:hypothetical protein
MAFNPPPSSPVERALTIVPPVLGWNTKDPLSDMDPRYSPALENVFPGNGAVELRNGYTEHVKTAVGGACSHLAELVNNAGTHFLIGFIGSGAPYNFTSAGAGTAITGGFTLGSGFVYTVNFRGRLFCKGYVSGSSDMFYTDGTAATLAAFTGPGGDDKDLWRLTTYKGRLYALQITDASMWYGGLDAVTGAMTQYDFQSLFILGGKPWYIGPFSMTGGDITQEYFCVISEQGEVLLYGGDYPGAATWGIVNRLFIPAPVGRASFFSWGSDILIISYSGLISLREYLGTPQGESYIYLSDNIASEFKAAAEASSALGISDFIQGIVYPKGKYLLINFITTLSPALTSSQFVMNTQTRAWTKFTGQNAYCWSLLNNNLYWGGSVASSGVSYVAKADNGYKDVDPADSSLTLTRTIKCRHAFNYLGSPTKRKQFTAATPTVYQSENLSITLNCDVDYTDTTATSTEVDTSKGTSYQIYQPKCGLVAESGNAVSIRIDGTVTTKRFRLEATKVYWQDATDF